MERRVFSNLKKIMTDVPYVDHFIQEENKDLKAQYAAQTAEQTQTKLCFKKVKRDIEATLVNLSKRLGSNSLLEQLDKLEEEEKRLSELLKAETPEPYPNYTEKLAEAFTM